MFLQETNVIKLLDWNIEFSKRGIEIVLSLPSLFYDLIFLGYPADFAKMKIFDDLYCFEILV